MMTEWHELSHGFRTCVHELLAATGADLCDGIAAFFPRERRVICGVTPLHWDGRPCGRHAECEDCRAFGATGREVPVDLSVVPSLSQQADDLFPPLSLALICPPPPDKWDENVAALRRILVSIQKMRREWVIVERDLTRRVEVMTAIDNMCRFAGETHSPEETERLLGDCLDGFGSVVGWAALLQDWPAPPKRVPSSGESMAVADDLMAEISALQAIRDGDSKELPSSTSLFARVRPLLVRVPGREAMVHDMVIFAVPLLQSHAAAEGRARLWILLAAFPRSDPPSGPTLGLIRLFGQMGLNMWYRANKAAAEVLAARERVAVARETVRHLPSFAELIGESEVMGELCLSILQASRSDRNVILVGESGTGKELVARLVHQHSSRADFPAIARQVAREIHIGQRLWRSFHPAGLSMGRIVLAEYRDVPGAAVAPPGTSCKELTSRNGPADDCVSRAFRDWRPPEEQLEQELSRIEAEEKVHHGWRHIYRYVLATLYGAWREDRLFNFLEFDSGASMAEHAAASELFGVVPERYTDVKGAPGRFQVASHCGGTLFLDNIHHLDLIVQRALLKATEVRQADRRVSRAGGAVPEPVNVRIIASTVREPNDLVLAGRMLEELRGRLTGQVIRVPPLRDRMSDIPMLCRHFASQFGKEIPDDACEPLLGYDWRDVNVRGLQNVIETAAELADGRAIASGDVAAAMATALGALPGPPINAEKRMVLDALAKAKGNKAAAARIIGWSRQKLYRAMDDHGIPRGHGHLEMGPP